MGAKSKKPNKRKFIESQRRKSHMRLKNRINLSHENETDKQFNEENNFVNVSGPSTSEQKLVESPLTVLDSDDHSVHTSRLYRQEKVKQEEEVGSSNVGRSSHQGESSRIAEQEALGYTYELQKMEQRKEEDEVESSSVGTSSHEGESSLIAEQQALEYTYDTSSHDEGESFRVSDQQSLEYTCESFIQEDGPSTSEPQYAVSIKAEGNLSSPQYSVSIQAVPSRMHPDRTEGRQQPPLEVRRGRGRPMKKRWQQPQDGRRGRGRPRKSVSLDPLNTPSTSETQPTELMDHDHDQPWQQPQDGRRGRGRPRKRNAQVEEFPKKRILPGPSTEGNEQGLIFETQLVRVPATDGRNENDLLIEIQPKTRKKSSKNDVCLRKYSRLRYCAVPTCLKDEKTNPGLTLFHMPFDTLKRKQWLRQINRPDIWQLPVVKATKHHVCILHFEKKYFARSPKNDSTIHLTSPAIPTLFLPPRVKEKRTKSEGPKDRKNTRRCVVSNCRNNSANFPHLKFFRIPQMPKKNELWTKMLGSFFTRKTAGPYFVCQNHFRPDHIKKVKGTLTLTPHAVPTCFNDNRTGSGNQIPPPVLLNRSTQTPQDSAFINIKHELVNSGDHETAEMQLDEGAPSEESRISVNNPEIKEKYVFILPDDSETEQIDDALLLIKTEPQEFEDQVATKNIEDTITMNEHDPLSSTDPTFYSSPRIVNVCSKLTSDASTTTAGLVILMNRATSSNDLIKIDMPSADKLASSDNLKVLYERGSAEMKLFFDLCDKYLDQTTASAVKLKVYLG